MAKRPNARLLELPLLQNWSCHNCGGCCKKHLIEITEAERQRIDSQGWNAAELPEGLPPYVPLGRTSEGRYRLSQRADGACVFLTDEGLCQIHARFGEPAKPLPCRLYPYVFHPTGKGLVVGLRYSCPSVIRNAGRDLGSQQAELKQLAQETIADWPEEIPAPRLSDRSPGAWPLVDVLIAALLDELQQRDVPLRLRLVRMAAWTELISTTNLTDLTVAQLRETIRVVRETVAQLLPDEQTVMVPPADRLTLVGFTQLVAYYTREDTIVDQSKGWAGRWKLLQDILVFTFRKGRLPDLATDWKGIPIRDVEQALPWNTPAAAELLTRYLVTKLQSRAFFGPAYYHEPVIEGFWSLLLTIPVTIWLARWHALARRYRAGPGSTSEPCVIQAVDLEAALARVDHNHGYSPALGMRSVKSRLRSFVRRDQLTSLIWDITRES
ncbi:Flagellin N-methylase [Planctopirus ephydatiae]|uniref:Flagellin N-methylase n=1 Tax=Planctopirus ephydatiae TaxID=2528019 RepID=A0A518GIA7_9PLAN|nr:YkgJ family cysteine cluster protein [Planctopirus ephydatiae]QDV28326.1 Flagellin N-methylase [Planctopirus ephydatiae]